MYYCFRFKLVLSDLYHMRQHLILLPLNISMNLPQIFNLPRFSHKIHLSRVTYFSSLFFSIYFLFMVYAKRNVFFVKFFKWQNIALVNYS